MGKITLIIITLKAKKSTLLWIKDVSIHFPHKPRLFHLPTEKVRAYSVTKCNQSAYSRTDTMYNTLNNRWTISNFLKKHIFRIIRRKMQKTQNYMLKKIIPLRNIENLFGGKPGLFLVHSSILLTVSSFWPMWSGAVRYSLERTCYVLFGWRVRFATSLTKSVDSSQFPTC